MLFEHFINGATVSIGEFREAVSKPLMSRAAMGYAFTCLMRAEQEGFACALLLDKKRRYITTVCLKRHGEMAEHNVLDLLAEATEKYDAAYFVVAHNHKAGILAPSGADLTTTTMISQHFLDEKAQFLDHFIVAGDAYMSILDRRVSKKYIKLKDLLK